MLRRGESIIRNRYASKPPLYGMAMVFLAMAVVAVTAYFRMGWWSIIGYAAAAIIHYRSDRVRTRLPRPVLNRARQNL